MTRDEYEPLSEEEIERRGLIHIENNKLEAKNRQEYMDAEGVVVNGSRCEIFTVNGVEIMFGKIAQLKVLTPGAEVKFQSGFTKIVD